MSEVATTRLYRLRKNLPCEERVAAYEIQDGEILWLIGSRPSSLGGYIGNFQRTYRRDDGAYCPNGTPLSNYPMRYFEEVS